MTDINLNDFELKNANVSANVGEKEVSVSVRDADEAKKAQEQFDAMIEQLRNNPDISDVKVTEGSDSQPQ